MSIGEIGKTFRSTFKIDYQSQQTLLDVDFLILNLDTALFPQNRSLANILVRKEKLAEFVSHKKVPIILIAPEEGQTLLVNAHQVRNYDLYELLPFSPFSVKNEIGNVISILPGTEFTDFFTKYEIFFNFKSYFSSYEGKVLVHTPYTKCVLSFINGNCLFLPNVEGIPDEKSFLDDLTAAVSAFVKNKNEQISLPEWTTRYLLPTEQQKIDKKVELTRQMEAIHAHIDLTEKELEILAQWKVLLTGSGDRLEEKVTKLFSELGCELLPVEIGRADLIIKYGEVVAVIEVKGVTGTAAEKYAAQLEKWVSEHYEVTGHEPKGILIVNVYKDEEIAEREGKVVFPDQMLAFSRRKEHCLLTTTQLLCLFFEIQQHPERKDELMSGLLTTVGIYNGFPDWKTYIQVPRLQNIDQS